jgi:hypothetical protein
MPIAVDIAVSISVTSLKYYYSLIYSPASQESKRNPHQCVVTPINSLNSLAHSEGMYSLAGTKGELIEGSITVAVLVRL